MRVIQLDEDVFLLNRMNEFVSAGVLVNNQPLLTNNQNIINLGKLQ